jgi:plasmid stability protein
VPVTFTIRNVPDEIANRIRKQAEEAHRSLQGELMRILEESVHGPEVLTLGQIREKAASYGIGSPTNESARMIREDRDAR